MLAGALAWLLLLHRRVRSPVAYPPIGRHGAIGDRRTAALIASEGTIDWLCLPDYDDDPVFAALLDAHRGGFWRVGPAQVLSGRQRYVDGTAVLTTEWSTDQGTLELTDAMPWPDDHRAGSDEPRRVVLRRLQCTGGAIACVVQLAPRGLLVGDLRFERDDGAGLVVRMFGRHNLQSLGIWSTHALEVSADGREASARFVLRAGETAWMVLAAEEDPSAWTVRRAEEALCETVRFWRRWVARFEGEHAHAAALRRSLLTTHLLAYAPTGAMVAAPTLGLPESIGGTRNYDYRYAWIRDASLSASSLSSVGDNETAERYVRWLSVLDSSTSSPLQVVYDVRGGTNISQHRLRRAAGYRGSQPVRVGNHAYDQRQLGSLGFLVDCMASGLDRGAVWHPEYSGLLRRIAEHTCRSWREADSGIWELQRHQQFVASKVMCWVVLDRAARIGQRIEGFHPADIARWSALAEEIRDAIQARGYGERLGAFRRRYDHDSVDASALLVPLMGFLPPDDPRVLSTLDRIEEILGVEGFVYRFRPDESEGEVAQPLEGAFLPCSFWLATARAMAGQIDRAERLLERPETLSGELGLFAEEVDPRTGQFLGNYPLLFSHVEHIRAIVALQKARSLAGAMEARTSQPASHVR